MNANAEIIGQLERGEISPQDAISSLRGGVAPAPANGAEAETSQPGAEGDPRQMVTLGDAPAAWPWPDTAWQWCWQDADHPVHVDQEYTVAAGGALEAVLYTGDLRVAAGPEGVLQLGAGLFDLRVAHGAEGVRVAGAAGSLDVGLPLEVAALNARVVPGDARLSGLALKQLQVECAGGGCRIERTRVDELAVRCPDGAVQLRRVEGLIEVAAGSVDARGIGGAGLRVEASGEIALELAQAGQGPVHGATTDGDIEIILPRATSCAVVATAQEVVCAAGFNWTRLSERSGRHVRGELGGGGPAVELAAPRGRIFLQMD